MGAADSWTSLDDPRLVPSVIGQSFNESFHGHVFALPRMSSKSWWHCFARLKNFGTRGA